MKTKMQALGLIETRGFISAVEALDVAVKTADVALLGIEFIGSGLVTIQITGDVAAVKVSVDGAVIGARKVGEVVAAHVIPRPLDDLAVLLPSREVLKEEPEEPKSAGDSGNGELELEENIDSGAELELKVEEDVDSEPELKAEESVDSEPKSGQEEDANPEPKPELEIEIPKFETPKQKTPEKDKGIEQDFPRHTEEELSKMKVVDLRTLIRGFPGLKIKRNQIKFMNKEELLVAIQAFYQQFNTKNDI